MDGKSTHALEIGNYVKSTDHDSQVQCDRRLQREDTEGLVLPVGCSSVDCFPAGNGVFRDGKIGGQ